MRRHTPVFPGKLCTCRALICVQVPRVSSHGGPKWEPHELARAGDEDTHAAQRLHLL